MVFGDSTTITSFSCVQEQRRTIDGQYGLFHPVEREIQKHFNENYDLPQLEGQR
jgi:hypothetical protein